MVQRMTRIRRLRRLPGNVARLAMFGVASILTIAATISVLTA